MSHNIDDYYDVYDEIFPQARKEHVCDACKETIPRGCRYAKVSIVFEGSAESVKRCLRCQTIHEHLRGIDVDMWPAERLDCGEEYREHWGADPPEEIANLAFAAPSEVHTTRELERFDCRVLRRQLSQKKPETRQPRE